MTGFWRWPGKWMAVACCAGLFLLCGWEQGARAQPPRQATVPVLMVSDIHFEPFWDPAKAVELAAAPVTQWRAILAAPNTADRRQRFADLQIGCHDKGTDTLYPLLASSLAAMRADAAGARFITLSGDLIAHDFGCKFNSIFPHATPSDYRAFVAKTVEFVALELHASFPGVPLYTALGNNDTDCGDYQLDAHGTLLANVGPQIVADLGVREPERNQALKDFMSGGYYDVALPAPMRHARLVVLDDQFMAKKYRSCSGAPDPKAAADQIAWLREQLESARRDHERVWVMAHIPPGVDPYSTARKMRDVCGGESPEMFLSSGALAATLADFGDVIRLVILGHTHMDELRLLEPPGGESAAHPAVAVKIVGSISPVDQNNSSFTVARVDAATAELVDYQVFAASGPTGVRTVWSKEYDFRATYGVPAFTASSVAELIARFRADPGAQSQVSQSYLRNYFVGDRSKELVPFWPQYVCALANSTQETYRACVCPSGK